MIDNFEQKKLIVIIKKRINTLLLHCKRSRLQVKESEESDYHLFTNLRRGHCSGIVK